MSRVISRAAFVTGDAAIGKPTVGFAVWLLLAEVPENREVYVQYLWVVGIVHSPRAILNTPLGRSAVIASYDAGIVSTQLPAFASFD